jgi:hypothetical protein
MKTKIPPIVDTVDTIEVADRRREGRRDAANPELIGLLRGTGGAGFLTPDENDDTNELSAARGVKAAISISTIFWAVVVASGAFWFFR